jgi:hypothetical protein
MSPESFCFELKAVSDFLSQVSQFHLQVAKPQILTENPRSPTKAHLLHRDQADFYEVLVVLLSQLSTGLNKLEIHDLHSNLLEALAKASEMIDRMISTDIVTRVWGEAGIVSKSTCLYISGWDFTNSLGLRITERLAFVQPTIIKFSLIFIFKLSAKIKSGLAERTRII